MMPMLNTPVGMPRLPFKLDFASGIVSLGSCFADEVGARLQEGGFHIELNPFGTLYNPASMAEALHRLVDDRPIGMDDLVKQDGLWHSWHHHGSFSHTTPGATLTACNASIHRAHTALKEADLLMLTFGTAWVFEYEGKVVANCHKVPNNLFNRRRMTVDEILALWTPLLQELAAYYPKMNILFSVSPIRHMADGAHGNQLSKSTLLLAIDQLVSSEQCSVFSDVKKNHGTTLTTSHSTLNTYYFPSYEVVLDELRDYRYFGPDMAHPTELAVDVVWEHFQHATMKPAVRQQAQFNAKQAKRAKHIPIH